MSAIANVVLNDALATPVAHTFGPVTTDGSLAKWADRSPGIPSGFRILSLEVVPPSGNRTTHKSTVGLYNPTVATVNGVDTVVRYSSFKLEFNIHPDATLQERKDLIKYAREALANAIINASVESLEPAY